MRALWFLNSPIGKIASVLGFPPSQSGTWIDATAKELEAEPNISLGIATTSNISMLRKASKDGVAYYCIAGGFASRGKRASKKNLAKWREVIDDFKPDVVHLWGSEFTDFLDVLDAAPQGTPVVMTPQGLIRAIEKYNGLSFSEVKKVLTFSESLMYRLKINSSKAKLQKQTSFEDELLKRVDVMLTDNEWARRICIPFNNIDFANWELPVNSVFTRCERHCDASAPYTIMCNAGFSPLKGMHQMFKALALIKESFPQVKLLIPGSLASTRTLRKFIGNPYLTYLRKLAKSLNIENNIQFLGQLTSEEMATRLADVRVYAMVSCIENHSLSLREAMTVGLPCVVANVGSVAERAHHGQNAFLYRYEEYEILASYIIEFFTHPALADEFGKRARTSMLKYLNQTTSLATVYQKLMNRVQ